MVLQDPIEHFAFQSEAEYQSIWMSLPDILFQQILFDELKRWEDAASHREPYTSEMMGYTRREFVASRRGSTYTGSCLDRLVCV
jgi:hypothetical protein